MSSHGGHEERGDWCVTRLHNLPPILISCLEEVKWGFLPSHSHGHWLAFSWPLSEAFPTVGPGNRGRLSERHTGWTFVLRDLFPLRRPSGYQALQPWLLQALWERRGWRPVSAQFRPLPNWKVCGSSAETLDFPLSPTLQASPFPLPENLPPSAAPQSFYSVGSISSCLLEELNCGYKHVNVNHPGPPPLPPFVLANTQNLIKQFGPSFLQFKTSMCCVHAS